MLGIANAVERLCHSLSDLPNLVMILAEKVVPGLRQIVQIIQNRISDGMTVMKVLCGIMLGYATRRCAQGCNSSCIEEWCKLAHFCCNGGTVWDHNASRKIAWRCRRNTMSEKSIIVSAMLNWKSAYEAVSDQGPVWVQSEDKIPTGFESNPNIIFSMPWYSLVTQLSEKVWHVYSQN